LKWQEGRRCKLITKSLTRLQYYCNTVPSTQEARIEKIHQTHCKGVEPMSIQEVSQKTEIPGFGQYVLAIFLTPIYYGLKGKWGAFIATAILYLIATLTMPLLGLGIVFWMAAAAPATWSLRNDIMVAHARRTGEETAAAIDRQQQRAAQQ